MINIKPRNKYGNSTPANSDYQILSHPSGNNQRSIELAIFLEHRFAFYYWCKWNSRNQRDSAPDLITFDWHQDLVYPCSTIKSELQKLDLKNKFEVSFFSWARLNSLNDDHIMAATYLNQIKNVWVVCKQGHISGMNNEEIIDHEGNKHIIRKFSDKSSLFKQLKNSQVSEIYLDIDLDYFTIDNISSNDKFSFSYMSNKEIREIFSGESEFMKWIFQRLEGFTIALEPEHTGGIKKSLEYLSLLNDMLFEGDIMHSNCKWKHLI